MLKRFASPYFILPSFVLILGLFVPNPHAREFWAIMLAIFIFAYGLAVLMTHFGYTEPEKEPEKPEPVKLSIPVMVQRRAEVPRNLHLVHSGPGKDKQKVSIRV